MQLPIEVIPYAEIQKRLSAVNWLRLCLHILPLISIVLLYQAFPKVIPYSITALFFIMLIIEIIRLKTPAFNKFFIHSLRWILRDYEKNNVMTAVQTLLGIVMVIWLFPDFVAQAAILVLALADPAATIVGNLKKGRSIFTDYPGKTWVGTVASAIVALMVLYSFAIITNHQELLPWAVILSSGAAMLGEALHRPSTIWNDNWTIPVFTAIMLWSVMNFPNYLIITHNLIKVFIK